MKARIASYIPPWIRPQKMSQDPSGVRWNINFRRLMKKAKNDAAYTPFNVGDQVTFLERASYRMPDGRVISQINPRNITAVQYDMNIRETPTRVSVGGWFVQIEGFNQYLFSVAGLQKV